MPDSRKLDVKITRAAGIITHIIIRESFAVFAIWILRSKSAARYVVNGTELNVMRGESDNIVQNV
jgi:hypothetical protein